MNRIFALSPILLAAALTCGCDRPTAPSRQSVAESAATEGDLQAGTSSYAVTGIVHRIQADGQTAIIAHDLIPGYMMAMTMPFEAKDPKVLQGVYPGDQITFRLLVRTNDAWIDKVQRTGLKTNTPSPRVGAFGLNLKEELDVGDLLPDCVLTNDLGQPFQLSAFRGRALALTFVFTRCPLPTYCPLMSRNFAEAAELMASATTLTNWHLLTISFDPDFDSPRVLNSYASPYRSDSKQWTFATGDRAAVEELGREFGLLLFREDGTISHNLRTVVADPEGRIRHVFRDNQWDPADLALQLRSAAQRKSSTPKAGELSCTLTISGMSCDACALTIQSALRKLPGVATASVDYSNRLATVTYDPSRIVPAAMVRQVKALTYDARVGEP
jgi:protein SCO1/2